MNPLRAVDVADAEPVAVEVTPAARGRGHRLPTTIATIRLRDALLVGAAVRFAPEQSSLAQAEFLHRALSRFAAGAWRREWVLDECPLRWRGRIEEHCWRILKARDRILSVSAIRQIIAAAKRTSSDCFSLSMRDVRITEPQTVR